MFRRLTICALFFSSSASADEVSDNLGVFDACYLQQVALFSRLCEPADMVAIAIVNGCPREYEALQSSLIRKHGIEGADKLVAKMKIARKEQAIAALMRYRLETPCPQ